MLLNIEKVRKGIYNIQKEAYLCMNKRKALKIFGTCYSNGEFESLSYLLYDNVVYESYDCMYKIIMLSAVVKILNESIKKGTSAFSGFYLRKGILINHLTECILICEDDTFQCIRIINIRIKRGKIITITGYDPKDYKYTRGQKISAVKGVNK